MKKPRTLLPCSFDDREYQLIAPHLASQTYSRWIFPFDGMTSEGAATVLLNSIELSIIQAVLANRLHLFRSKKTYGDCLDNT